MFVSARYRKNVYPGGFTTVTHCDATDDGLIWQLAADSTNADWQRYLADGGVIDPYVEPPPEAWNVNVERA
jgi:hypothetical protein